MSDVSAIDFPDPSRPNNCVSDKFTSETNVSPSKLLTVEAEASVLPVIAHPTRSDPVGVVFQS